jgi:hypothetical protein
MKTYLTLLTIAITMTANSQISAGAGIGFGDKTNFVAQLSLNWNAHHHFGFDMGFTSAPATDKPTFFTLQGYAPIINNEAWKVGPMGGYAYKLLNEDTKAPGVNGGSWIVGLEAAKNINNRGVLYFRGNYTQSFAWITVGIRGFLGRRDYCY